MMKNEKLYKATTVLSELCEVAEVSVDLDNILIALVVLCLSQIFARGMELETDVDGLL